MDGNATNVAHPLFMANFVRDLPTRSFFEREREKAQEADCTRVHLSVYKKESRPFG